MLRKRHGFNPIGKPQAILLLTFLLAACGTPPTLQKTSPRTPAPAAMSIKPTVSASQSEVNHINDRALAEQEMSLHLSSTKALLEQGNGHAALANLDAYDKKWSPDRQSKQLRADALRKLGQLDQAEAIYQSLLSSNDQQENGAILYSLGKLAIERGDLKTALGHFEKSIQIDPLGLDVYTDLGLAYLLDGQKEPAYNTLLKANELANGDLKTMTNLALWGLVFDDFTMAMEIADRLKWTDNTRKKLLLQANSIKRRLNIK